MATYVILEYVTKQIRRSVLKSMNWRHDWKERLGKNCWLVI